MEFKIEEFASNPTIEVLDRCTKAQLGVIADHYEISVNKQDKKKVLKQVVWEGLEKMEVLPGPSESLASIKPVGGQSVDNLVRLKEIELEMKRAELEQRKFEANMVMERFRIEEENKQAIRLRELDINQTSAPQSGGFDVSKNIRLVPPFSEKDVDKYFTMFERVAVSFKWPKTQWTMLLQCVLVGKAQDAYASLSVDDSLNYDTVKEAILRTYEFGANLRPTGKSLDY